MDKISFLDKFRKRLSELPISKDDVEKESLLMKSRIDSLDETLLRDFLTEEKIDILISEIRSELYTAEGSPEHKTHSHTAAFEYTDSEGTSDFSFRDSLNTKKAFHYSDTQTLFGEDGSDDDSDVKIYRGSDKKSSSSHNSRQAEDEDADVIIFKGSPKNANQGIFGDSAKTENVRISGMTKEFLRSEESTMSFTPVHDIGKAVREPENQSMQVDILPLTKERANKEQAANTDSESKVHNYDDDVTIIKDKNRKNIGESAANGTSGEKTSVQTMGAAEKKSKDDKTTARAPETKSKNERHAAPRTSLSDNERLITSDELSNHHPRLYMLIILFVMLPFVLLFLVSVLGFFVAANVLLIVTMAFCTLLYFAVVLFFSGCGLYSLISAILYLRGGDTARSIAEIGVLLATLGVALLCGYFLLPLVKKAIALFTSSRHGLNQKIGIFLRDLRHKFGKAVDRL